MLTLRTLLSSKKDLPLSSESFLQEAALLRAGFKLIGTLLLSLPLQAQQWPSHPWDSFLGCYHTVKVNGQLVTEQDPKVNYAHFRRGYDDHLWTAAGEALPVLRLQIFLKTAEDVPGLPPGNWRELKTFGTTYTGRYFRQDSTEIYEEEGIFKSILDGDRLLKVVQSAKLTPLDSDRLLVELSRKSQGVDGQAAQLPDFEGTYEIRRCQQLMPKQRDPF